MYLSKKKKKDTLCNTSILLGEIYNRYFFWSNIFVLYLFIFFSEIFVLYLYYKIYDL